MEMQREDQQKKDLLHEIVSIPVFKGLDQNLLNEIARYLEHIVLDAGDYLLHQNIETDAMYFVVQGSLYARTTGPDGEEVVLGKIGPGDPVGEIHILNSGAPMADVIAQEKTELLKLSKKSLETIAEKKPQAIDKIYEIAGNRLLRDHLAAILPEIFGPLDRQIITDIQKQAEWIHLPLGDTLFREGDPGDSLYLVIMGRLRVVTDQNGKEKIIGEAAQGECIGEMAIITSEPRLATVYAIRDCELIRFSKELFEKLLDAYPRVMLGIIRILIDRLKKTSCQSSASSGKITNIAIVPVSAGISAPAFISRFVESLSSFGQVCRLDSRLIENTFPASKDGSATWNKTISIQLGAWLHKQEIHHSFVVYEADTTLTPWTLKCLSQADQVVFLSHSSCEAVPSLFNPDQFKDITHVSRVMVILHSGKNNIPCGTGQLLEVWGVDRHHHVCVGSDDDIQRIARIFAGKAVGLVLGGGGARALAHIGAIRALKEHGIPIDMIGGTSMGAVIASGYALGWDEEKLITSLKMFFQNNVFSDYTLPVFSLIRCLNLDHAMMETYGDTQVEDLWINYFCTSSNLSMAALEVHRCGLLWQGIRASVSLPGIAVPVIKDGDLHVDGAVLNNLPVDVMRELCRGKTIALDVSQVEDLKVRQSKFPSPWKAFYEKLMKTRSDNEFPGILDILLRTAELASINQRRKTIEEADLYLNLPVQDFKLLEFESMDELIDIGYRHTKQEIARWEKEGLWDRCTL